MDISMNGIMTYTAEGITLQDDGSDYYVKEVVDRFPENERLELRHLRRQIEFMAEDYHKYGNNCLKLTAGFYKKRIFEIVQYFIDNDIIKFEDADSVVSWYLKYYYRMGYFGIRMPFDFSSLFHKKGV